MQDSPDTENEVSDATFSNGDIIRAPNGNLFVIAGGVRWEFRSMAEFNALGYDMCYMRRVAQAIIDTVPGASADHPPADGTLLQGPLFVDTVWVMKGGVRRSFRNPAQLSEMGYATSQIVRVPRVTLESIPSGGDLP